MADGSQLDFETTPSYSLTVTVTDDDGDSDTATITITVNDLDEIPPIVPTIDLDTGSDSGVSDTDNITNDNTPTFSGVTEAGVTVQLLDLTNGNAVIGTTTADGSGNWSITPAALADGDYTVQARAVDAANNESFSVPLSLTIDTVAPSVSGGGDQTVDEGVSATLTGTAVDAGDPNPTVLWHFIDSTTGQIVPDSNTNTITFTPTDNGTYRFDFSATDAAGNTGGPEMVIVTVNNVAPVANPDAYLTDEDTVLSEKAHRGCWATTLTCPPTPRPLRPSTA